MIWINIKSRIYFPVQQDFLSLVSQQCCYQSTSVMGNSFSSFWKLNNVRYIIFCFTFIRKYNVNMYYVCISTSKFYKRDCNILLVCAQTYKVLLNFSPKLYSLSTLYIQNTSRIIGVFFKGWKIINRCAHLSYFV